MIELEIKINTSLFDSEKYKIKGAIEYSDSTGQIVSVIKVAGKNKNETISKLLSKTDDLIKFLTDSKKEISEL